jgi:hypothetical protein
MSFWDILWFIIISYVFIAYLMLLFNILADVFRDDELSGFGKAGWTIFLVLVPLLAALVYLDRPGDRDGRAATSPPPTADRGAG